MDWREQQREANERLRKQADDDRRRREDMTRRLQEDSRRRLEEAKRLQERREDQQRAERFERQRREENNRAQAALDRQTQAIQRSSEVRHVEHGTLRLEQAVSKNVFENPIEFEPVHENTAKPRRRFRAVWRSFLILSAILIFWASGGVEILAKFFDNQLQPVSPMQQPRAKDALPRREAPEITRSLKTQPPPVKVYPPCTATRVDQCTQ